jgi:hypothetical protein
VEKPLEKLLPQPQSAPLVAGGPVRHGTRVVLPTYQSVLELVRRSVGVGPGHIPTPQDRSAGVSFTPLDRIRVSSENEGRKKALLEQTRIPFALYRRREKNGPRNDGLAGAIQFVAEAIKRAARGYEHRYT